MNDNDYRHMFIETNITLNFCNFNFFNNSFINTKQNHVKENINILFDQKINDDKTCINIIFEKNLQKKWENMDNLYIIYDDNNLIHNLTKLNNLIDKYWNTCVIDGPIHISFFKNTLLHKRINNKRIAIYIAGACTHYNITFESNINFYRKLENLGYTIDFYISLDNSYYIKYYTQDIFGTNINGHVVTKNDEKLLCDPYIVFKDLNVKNYILSHSFYKNKIKYLNVHEDKIERQLDGWKRLYVNLNKLFRKKNECLQSIINNELLESKYDFYIYHRPDNLFVENSNQKLDLNYYFNKLLNKEDCCFVNGYKKFRGKYIDMIYPNIFLTNSLKYCFNLNFMYINDNLSRNNYDAICNNCSTEYQLNHVLKTCKVCFNNLKFNPLSQHNFLEGYLYDCFKRYRLVCFPISFNFWCSNVYRG